MALNVFADSGTIVILADSEMALSYLARWQSGDVAAIPPGYSLRSRIGTQRSRSQA